MLLKCLLLFLFFIHSSCHDANEAQTFCAHGQSALGSKCFQFFNVRTNFITAESMCEALSGHLVSIHNSTDNEKVASLAREYTKGRFWIGAKARTAEVNYPSNWHWTDKSRFNYQNYELGQPETRGKQTCMRMDAKTELWLTGQCEDVKHGFACEFPTQETPTCSCPTIPSHCPSGYTWFDKTDFCYKNYVRRSSFADAQGICQADGGDLVSIHSQAENDLIVDLTKTDCEITHGEDKASEVWIGLVLRDGTWQWTDGTNVTYTKWNPGEPNEMHREFWTRLYPDGLNGFTERNVKGLWNNVNYGYNRAFVCKRAALH